MIRNRLNQMASNAITEIAQSTDGQFLQYPFFLDCVIEINDAACKSSVVLAQDNFFEAPSFAGTIPLFPLTIGGKEWLSKYAYPVLPNAEDQHYAVGFAMASKERDLIKEVSRSKDIKREVAKFRAQLLPVTFDAFVNAIKYHLPDDPSGLQCRMCGHELPSEAQEEAVESANWSPVLCMLQREYGQSKDYWLWEASEAEINAKVDDFVNRAHASENGAGDIAAELNFKAFRKTVKQVKAEVIEWIEWTEEPDAEED